MSSPRRRYHAPIRQEHAEATRLRIRTVAALLFVERGYAATSMVDLANAAGLSVPTLYAAFGSKRGIATAIIEAATRQPDVRQLLEEVLETPGPRQQLLLAARITRRILERGGEVIELLQRAGNEELLEEWRSWEARRLRGQRPLVRSLAAKGVLRRDLSVDRAADILWMLTGRDVYTMLVTQRGWSGDYYERWLAGVLARELLEGQDQQSAPP
jgi:AcrR family transcriptional regulator